MEISGDNTLRMFSRAIRRNPIYNVSSNKQELLFHVGTYSSTWACTRHVTGVPVIRELVAGFRSFILCYGSHLAANDREENQGYSQPWELRCPARTVSDCNIATIRLLIHGQRVSRVCAAKAISCDRVAFCDSTKKPQPTIPWFFRNVRRINWPRPDLEILNGITRGSFSRFFEK